MLTYTLSDIKDNLYEHLYKCIRDDIVSGTLPAHYKLPSKRSFAKNLSVSTITVENAYNQLISEGFIYSLPRKGFYVSEIFEEGSRLYHNTASHSDTTGKKKPVKKAKEAASRPVYIADFSSNNTNPESFPFTTWAKLTRRILSDSRDKLMTNSPSGGTAELRSAILTPEALDSHFTNERGVEDTFRFLCNIMGTWLLQETRRTWTEQGKDISFADMEAMAAPLDGQAFRIDPDDAVFFPPGDMPERVRRYCREHGHGEIPNDAALVRCIYDSLADCFKKRIDQLETITGRKFDTLNILGGGTRDRFFMRLVARTTGRRVLAGPTEATAIGNILAQMIASGDLKNAAEARELVAKSFPLAVYG